MLQQSGSKARVIPEVSELAAGSSVLVFSHSPSFQMGRQETSA